MLAGHPSRPHRNDLRRRLGGGPLSGPVYSGSRWGLPLGRTRWMLCAGPSLGGARERAEADVKSRWRGFAFHPSLGLALPARTGRSLTESIQDPIRCSRPLLPGE